MNSYPLLWVLIGCFLLTVHLICHSDSTSKFKSATFTRVGPVGGAMRAGKGFSDFYSSSSIRASPDVYLVGFPIRSRFSYLAFFTILTYSLTMMLGISASSCFNLKFVMQIMSFSSRVCSPRLLLWTKQVMNRLPSDALN